MADFKMSLAKTLIFEGGYVNDIHDSGGETFKGISRKNWPGWNGWPIIDMAKQKPNFPTSLKVNDQLTFLVEQFYQHVFWSKYFDQMPQELADVVFDRSVNAGIGTAIRLLQKACGCTSDGVMGNQTMNAIAAQDPTTLVERFRQQSVDHYKAIVAENPKKARYLDGWLKRC
jgi:lysozyme family protein